MTVVNADMTVPQQRRSPAARLFLGLIQGYRLVISPLRLPCCRYAPTCSEYAVGAIERFGATRGTWLALRRLARCGPWHRGGFDPVPEPSELAQQPGLRLEREHQQ